jgi:hypothetical protein
MAKRGLQVFAILANGINMNHLHPATWACLLLQVFAILANDINMNPTGSGYIVFIFIFIF